MRDTLVKPRSVQERQSDVMERHRHWLVSGVAGSGAQRAGAREAAPRYHGEGHDIVVGENFEGGGNEGADFEGGRYQVQEQDDGKGRDADKDGAAAAGAGHVQKGSSADIQARLRRGPDVIMPETWANRAQRTRHPRELFQAGTKKEVKRLGKWRKDR